MKVLKYVAITLFALIGILVVIGLSMPKEWSVERTTIVNAEPARIHPFVGNLESWPKWIPWVEKDPAMVITFEGTPGAAGSKMVWDSEKMGKGALTLLRSDAATGMEYEMMIEGMIEPARGSLLYTKEEPGTRVTWKFASTFGTNPFLRLFGPVLEGMMSQDADQGLAKMKGLAEES